MRHIALNTETDWDGWRKATRALVLAGIAPEDLSWSVGGPSEPLPDASGTFHVPRTLVGLASAAIQARNPDRFGLLYALVWRANAGEKLLEDDADPDLALAKRLAL
ncbi:MAG TPA: uracil-DNA glycosylase, partial [Rhodopila sp.]|nr:uracil-DNA glycosylase [Rhodopila sp.]